MNACCVLALCVFVFQTRPQGVCFVFLCFTSIDLKGLADCRNVVSAPAPERMPAVTSPTCLHRDMWDRLTASTPTVTPESTFRQPIRRFTVSRPPRSACRFTCVSALYRLCVSSFPVGFSGPRGLRSGLASEALRVVLRGFVFLPLLTQGQLYAFYLFFTTRGGGSVSLITEEPPMLTGRDRCL